MTNLPQIIERVGAADFQTIAKFIPPEEVGGTMAVSANEKALVISGGSVVDMVSGGSRTVPSDAKVAVASLRHYHMVFGFGDCSRSPYNRPPAMIHVPDLPEIEASNGEILRSMTVAIRFSLVRDDRSNIEKLLELNTARRDEAITVRDLANNLIMLPTFIKTTFGIVKTSVAESIRFDKPYTDQVRQQILAAANIALGEYGMSASAATLDIYATSRDAERRLPESERENSAEYKAEISRLNKRKKQLDAQIEAEKLLLELDEYSFQREKIRTATMKHLEEQAEIQARIESLTPARPQNQPPIRERTPQSRPSAPRPTAKPVDSAQDDYAGSPSAPASAIIPEPDVFWLHDDAEITLHKDDCVYVLHFASPPKWNKYASEIDARRSTIRPIRGCRACNPLPGDPPIESLSIHEMARDGFTQRVFELISAGADVTKNDNGWTPLEKAALWARAEIVRALIDAGADVNAKDNRGNTPLHWAGDADTARTLIDAGADVNAKNIEGNTPLHTAASDGQTETAQALIAAGADVNAKNEEGDRPLWYADDHTQTAQALIDAGAVMR